MAALFKTVCQPFVILRIQIKEILVSGIKSKEVRVVSKRLFFVAVLAETFAFKVIIMADSLTIPVVAFYAKMAVGFYGEPRCSVSGFYTCLSKDNTCRNAGKLHLFYSYFLVRNNIIRSCIILHYR